MPKVSFSDLPYEIFCQILQEATEAVAHDGVSYTFGLSQATLPLEKPKTQKSVGGPARPDELKWAATKAIRSVCHSWHHWALGYTLRDVYITKGQGSERWADLHRGLDADKYRLYEFNNQPRGSALYHDPYRHLRQTVELIERNPECAAHIRRLWINGFYAAETDHLIWKLLRNCPKLESVSLPWTLLRRGTAEDWSKLLATETEYPLRSLELLSLEVSTPLSNNSSNEVDHRPLDYRRVNFSQLHRLKIFGNTDFMPMVDEDLLAIARTANHLEEIFIANNSSITVEGLTHLIASSRKTIRTIEHSPRSEHGFAHPHPGYPLSPPPPDSDSEDEHMDCDDSLHICTLLTSCPKLRDLSVSIPTMCPALFSTLSDTNWDGVVQVRAAGLCPTTASRKAHDFTNDTAAQLHAVLDAARALTAERARCGHDTTIELFYADCIFEPHLGRVHGDFAAPPAAHAAAIAQLEALARPPAPVHATRVDAPGAVPAPLPEAAAETGADLFNAPLDVEQLREQVRWIWAARDVAASGKGPYGKGELPWVWVDEAAFLAAADEGSIVLV